jgi:cyclopropane fatty-acyl-phospholipid synthase-like methyltransferase
MTSRDVEFVHPTGSDDLYASPPPWDLGRPQQAFLDLADQGALRGRVLDAGCGTGEHTLMAAGIGLDATGMDLAAAALQAAERKARERARTARFIRWDARHLADLPDLGEFDTVLDCGLFHAFDVDERAAYVGGLRSVLVPGGRFFMLCISDRQPEDGWSRVHRMSQGEIEASFADGWRIDSIQPATIEITTDPGGIRAWLAALTRS